jgi:hypothetical protein
MADSTHYCYWNFLFRLRNTYLPTRFELIALLFYFEVLVLEIQFYNKSLRKLFEHFAV